MQKIALIGSTELSARLIHYFSSTGFGETVGMFDDFEPVGKIKYDRPILGSMSMLPGLYRKAAFDSVAIAVGYSKRPFRKQAYDYVKSSRIPLATFVHPSSYVEGSASVGEGSIILVQCVLDMNACLKENVFMASHGFLSHDVKIGAHCYLGPSISLAGGTQVGECCFVGISTTTIEKITLGHNVQTAGGAVVTRDVPSDCMIAGVPATIKKKLAPLY